MTERRLPRPRDLGPLLQFQRPQLNRSQRRLAAALTIADLRLIAKRRTPRAAFDYTDGGAEAEQSLLRARQAFRDVEFHPTILRDVSVVDTSVRVLGGASALPFGIAPTGFTRLMHTARRRPARPAFRSRCRRSAPLLSRMWPRPTRTAGTGSSSTCGRIANDRSR
jgi:L-lactate dehydrogenase (cytochrome)